MLNYPSITVPLQETSDGTIRIGKSRVLLEILIHAFLRGETAEAIVEAYPSLGLDEVYSVLAYYLANRSEVDSYLRRVEVEAAQVRANLEAKQPQLRGLRTRLMQRLDTKE